MFNIGTKTSLVSLISLTLLFTLTNPVNAISTDPYDIFFTAFAGTVSSVTVCENGGNVFTAPIADGSEESFFQPLYMSLYAFKLPAIPEFIVLGDAVNLYVPCLILFTTGGFFGGSSKLKDTGGGLLVVQNAITPFPSLNR